MTVIDPTALQLTAKRMGWSMAQLNRLIDAESEKFDKKTRLKITTAARMIPKPL